VTKTLLAVDDSVTMRKVLEITFSGEDFSVITADSSQAALHKTSEPVHVAVIDTVIGGEDGYSLAKELRKRFPSTSIIMLASRYAPYDQARGRDAGADDWADKPFDTQQLIDKVRKVVLAKESGVPAPTAAPPPAAIPAPAPTPAPAVAMGSGGTGGFRPAATAPAAAAPGAGFGIGRGTQPSIGGAPAPGAAPAPGPLPARTAAAAPAPAASQAPTPAPAPVAPAPVAAAPAAPSPVQTAVNGHLAGKLGDLGLSPQQAEAVMALSREVVERIVWEVVPQLAEAIIKEEIARLTKEA
jgi:CheY-like chemotaxis protein